MIGDRSNIRRGASHGADARCIDANPAGFVSMIFGNGRWLLAAAVAMVLALATSPSVQAEEGAALVRWTTNDGHFFQAKFLRLQGTAIVVTRDGLEFTVPISGLSPASLEQARQKQPADAPLNRSLARMYERRGNFVQAMPLWQLVRKASPDDVEAQQKLTELAVHDTIHRGNLEQVLTEGIAAPGAASVEADSLGRLADPVDREARSLRGLLEEDPTSASVYLRLAQLYRNANRLEQAHSVLTEGLGATRSNDLGSTHTWVSPSTGLFGRGRHGRRR